MRRRLTLLVTVLAAILFAALNLLHEMVLRPVAAGLKGPDLQPGGMTPNAFRSWKAALENGGGTDTFLAWHSYGLDLVFPFVLSLALILLLRAALRTYARFAVLGPVAQLLLPAVVVIPYLVADIAENMAVARALTTSAPLDDPELLNIATATHLKYVFVILSFLLLAFVWLSGRLIKRAKAR